MACEITTIFGRFFPPGGLPGSLRGRWNRVWPALLILGAAQGCVSTEARIANHMTEAATHLNERRAAAALSEFQAVIRLDPDHSQARSNAAAIYLHLGDRAAAIREFKKAIQSDSNNQAAMFTLAEVYFQDGRYEEAEALFLILARETREEGMFIRLGQSAGLQGKHKQAISYLQAGVEHFQGSMALSKEIAIEAEAVDPALAVMAWDNVAQLASRFPGNHDQVQRSLRAAQANIPSLEVDVMKSILDAAHVAVEKGRAKLAGLPPSIQGSPVGLTLYWPGGKSARGFGEGGTLARNLGQAARAATAARKPGPDPVIRIDLLFGGWIPMDLEWQHRTLGERKVLLDARVSGPFAFGVHGVRLQWDRETAVLLPGEFVEKDWDTVYQVIRAARGRLGVPVGEEAGIVVDRFYAISFAGSGPSGEPVRLLRMNRQDITLKPSDIEAAYAAGADWLLRSIEPDGSFRYLYNTVTDEMEAGYNLARHAGTTLALFKLADALERKDLRDGGQRALENILARAQEMEGQRGLALEGGRVGPTALLVIAALEGEVKDEVLRSLGEFLLDRQRSSGRFDPIQLGIGGPRRSKWGPGQAVLALILLHRRLDDARYLDAARKGADYIVEERETDVGFILDHWFVQAAEEIDPYLHDERYVLYAYRIAEKLAGYVVTPETASYPDWVGGFSGWGQEPTGAASLGMFEALVSAYRLSKRRGTPRSDFRAAAKLCAEFALRLQIRRETAFYLPSPESAIGGFRQGLGSPRIRIDGVQHAALGLLGYRKFLLEDAKEKP
ncbi:MAG: tetratricopeptide repeat protein [Planctomycetota bacterium]|nr:tetratricopeptide repeat protein [Planctomycetota bacterium]